MDYFSELKDKMDFYAHSVYKITKEFPKHEIFGLTSQLRRASTSIVLNYIEGYARQKGQVKKNFWEISYGSLKESKYIVNFSHKEGYIIKNDYDNLAKLADEIGAMLWKAIQSIKP